MRADGAVRAGVYAADTVRGHSETGASSVIRSTIVTVVVVALGVGPSVAAAGTKPAHASSSATTGLSTPSPTSPSGATAPATSSSASTPAQPTFVATSPVLTFESDKTWRTTVQVINPGPATAVGLQLILLPECRSVGTVEQVSLGAARVTTIPISFTGPGFDPSSLTGATLVLVPPPLTVPAATPCQASTANLSATTAQVVGSTTTAVSSPTSASPAAAMPQPETITLTLNRITPIDEGLRDPLIAGGIFALIIVAVSWLWTRVKHGAAIPERIKAGSSWNFKDSFATNVTAIGGLLGAALAAAGSSSTLLPGVETSRFAMLSALWAAVAVAAPLVLAFGTKLDSVPGVHPNDPRQQATSVTFGLLMLCLWITLLAAGAELTTLAVLASESATSHAAVYAALIAFALLLGAYIVVTTATLISTQDGDKRPRTALNTFPDTSLAG